MRLYDAEWAPNPRRVRIFLAEKGIDLPRETIDLRQGDHLREPYLKVNPRGQVPALVLEDGEVLCESAAICRYLEALHPEPALFGATPLAIGRIESWTRRIEGDGYAAVVLALREARPAFRDRPLAGQWPAMPQIPELALRGQAMWRQFVDALDERLADREWIAGDAYSFADITALITIDFARSARLDVRETAGNVARWYAAASARPSASA
jgi:glutathione S-transferase